MKIILGLNNPKKTDLIEFMTVNWIYEKNKEKSKLKERIFHVFNLL